MLTVNIHNLKCTDGNTYDLTSPLQLAKLQASGFSLASPKNDRVTEHPLVLFFNDFNTIFAEFKAEWKSDVPVLVWNMFVPTSGWMETDEFGRYAPNFKLREQQVDFLLSYFESWIDLPHHNLVIGFCDESPFLQEIIEQVYDCMNLYSISKDRVFFMGHNFTGQDDINKFAQERKELPIKYITRWHMTGHMDFTHLESIAYRHGPQQFEYNTKTINWDVQRHNKLSFLNRRPSWTRSAMLWGMWDAGIRSISTISAFPPLRYFNAGTTEDDWEDQIVHWEYMGHVLQKYQPHLLDGMNEDAVKRFKKDMRVGKSIPGDNEHIGDVESQHIPSKNEFYVWVTCETVGDFDEPNMFITEKVLKPMVNGHALILFSQKDFLQKFKKLGYKTLGNHFGIDESYDSIIDDSERMTAVLKQVERIARMNLDELHQCWVNAKDDIIMNRKRMYLTLTNMRENYTENLVHHIVKEISSPYNKEQLLAYDVVKELKKYRNFSDFSVWMDN
jgi:hypothetical protein|tara:strand:- start:593 stop:2098 length:1506 start_codon:yes stop_codon:yes gene_type:complete